MKKAIALVVALMFVFALSTVSIAAEKAAAPAPKAEEKKAAAPAEKKEAPKKAVKKQITGEVKAVDAKANTLTVAKDKKEVTVSVDDQTKITAGKDKKTLADVKAGDKVTVKYEEVDGKATAKSVVIKAAPAKKEEKKAAPASAAPKAEEKKAAPAPAAPKAEEKKAAPAPAKKSGGY
ncbi:MAG: hypothetical protein OHK006_17540 [Thermodesulfovibrionales bacterium]